MRGLDFTDEATRRSVGHALRTTYELDAPMPEHLRKLMEQLQHRLDAGAATEPAVASDGPPSGDAQDAGQVSK